MTDEQTPKAQIMVVDDVSRNLRLMEAVLRSQGYLVRSFVRGDLALASAEKNPPDLFLVDVMMPEMDGYELCRRLKADPVLTPIPVIFLSGLNDTIDKVRAFEAGGVDYMTKPLSVEEVVARVDTHLNLRRLGQELERHNVHLDEQVRRKTKELEEANRRLSILDTSKSDFLAMISHELRTPLHGLFGVAELLFAEVPSNAESDELKQLFHESHDRLLTLIDDALLLTEVEVDAGRYSPSVLSLQSLLAPAKMDAMDFCVTRGVSIDEVPFGLPPVRGHERLLKRALCALLTTAAKFSASGNTIQLSNQSSQDCVLLSIEARGNRIPESALPGFFEVMGVGGTITPGGDLGLQTPMAARILQLFGGRVTVENLDPPGIRFHGYLRTAGMAPA
jgi:two-component system, sensor histidine kinase and response regulator